MVKDRLIVRMVFSGALIGFGILNLIYVLLSKLFYKLKIKKDLKNIKNSDLQKIIQESGLMSNNDIGAKEEIDRLLKDIYFNLYKKQKNNEEIKGNYNEMEYSIDNILDNNILTIIEEKDKLLQEKNQIIAMLEEKNEKFINETIGKISYIVQEKDRLVIEKENILEEKNKKIAELQKKIDKFINQGTHKIGLIIQEKDKLLKEKDMIILTLYKKIQSGCDLKTGGPSNLKTKAKPVYHYSENFINVNN